MLSIAPNPEPRPRYTRDSCSIKAHIVLLHSDRQTVQEPLIVPGIRQQPRKTGPLSAPSWFGKKIHRRLPQRGICVIGTRRTPFSQAEMGRPRWGHCSYFIFLRKEKWDMPLPLAFIKYIGAIVHPIDHVVNRPLVCGTRSGLLPLECGEMSPGSPAHL